MALARWHREHRARRSFFVQEAFLDAMSQVSEMVARSLNREWKFQFLLQTCGLELLLWMYSVLVLGWLCHPEA